MIARVTIIDDKGNHKGVYELQPSRIDEYELSTKYVFEFEYNKLKDKYLRGLLNPKDSKNESEKITATELREVAQELHKSCVSTESQESE